MDGYRVETFSIRIKAGAEIRAEIRDWETTPGYPMHGDWLNIGGLSVAFPTDLLVQLALLESISDAVDELMADTTAQLAKTAEAVAS